MVSSQKCRLRLSHVASPLGPANQASHRRRESDQRTVTSGNERMEDGVVIDIPVWKAYFVSEQYLVLRRAGVSGCARVCLRPRAKRVPRRARMAHATANITYRGYGSATQHGDPPTSSSTRRARPAQPPPFTHSQFPASGLLGLRDALHRVGLAVHNLRACRHAAPQRTATCESLHPETHCRSCKRLRRATPKKQTRPKRHGWRRGLTCRICRSRGSGCPVVAWGRAGAGENRHTLSAACLRTAHVDAAEVGVRLCPACSGGPQTSSRSRR